MAFLLINIDSRPVRLKGVRRFTGIAVYSGKGKLPVGSYRGINTNRVITVCSSGGQIFPSREAVAAYAAMNPVPVTLDESLAEIEDPLSEVFIEEGSKAILKKYRFSIKVLQDEFKDHWIPSDFSDEDELIGRGWIRQSDEHVDVMFVCDETKARAEVLRITPVFVPAFVFEVQACLLSQTE